MKILVVLGSPRVSSATTTSPISPGNSRCAIRLRHAALSPINPPASPALLELAHDLRHANAQGTG